MLQVFQATDCEDGQKEKEGKYEVTVQMTTLYNLFYFSMTMPEKLGT